MIRFLVAAGLLALAACGGSDDKPALEPKLSVVQSKVFDVSCTFSACHAGAAAQAGLDLTAGHSRASLLAASSEDPSRQRVAPGSPDASFLMDKLLGRNLPSMPVGQTTSVQMPQGSMLESERIELVRAWIAAGAKDD